MTRTAPRIEAVVFDLLYTLVHPGPYPGDGDRVAWLSEIIGVDTCALRARWDAFEPTLESGQAARIEGGTAPEIAWLESVASDLGTGISADDRALIEAGWDLTRRGALLAPPTDTLSTLAALRERNIRLGVLSNTHALELRSWDQSPLAHLFDVTAFSHEIGACKPNPAAYLHVLTRLGVPAASAAYVGDGGSNELIGAKEVGFALVVLAERAPAQLAPATLPRLRAQADTTITTLSQLPDLIER